MLTVLAVLLLAFAIRPAYATDFFCPTGDVTCLIEAINQANQTPEEDTIFLEPGVYNLLSRVDGPNGLPSIRTPIRIVGDADAATTIARAPELPPTLPFSFRIFGVADTGILTLDGIRVRRGNGELAQTGGAISNLGIVSILNSVIEFNAGSEQGGAITNHGTLLMRSSVLANNAQCCRGSGGGLANSGTATIEDSIIAFNHSFGAGGGVWNIKGGVLTVYNTTFEHNSAFEMTGVDGGGLLNHGTATVADSTFVENESSGRGAGIFSCEPLPAGSCGGFPFGTSAGPLTVINTTIARNRSIGPCAIDGCFGGGIFGGTVINSTIVDNEVGDAGGGVFGSVIQNTIVAFNRVGLRGSDCAGPVSSLGHNIIGDVSGCVLNVEATDIVSDPKLGNFVSNGPGTGHYPLLPESPAIDSANPNACPETDQLENPRLGICDRGAIEFRSGAGATVSVNVTTIAPGGTLTIEWSGIASPTGTDWIGLYQPGAPNTAFVDWIYVSCSKTPTSGRASGSCSFVVPFGLPPGTYELRLLANDAYTVLATSNAFSVNGGTDQPTFTVSPASVPAGGTLAANWSGIAAPSPTDWIGLYQPGAENTAFLEWVYVSCSRSSGGPQFSGTCPFVVPVAVSPGTYELRLLANDGFTVLGISNVFTITSGGETSLGAIR